MNPIADQIALLKNLLTAKNIGVVYNAGQFCGAGGCGALEQLLI